MNNNFTNELSQLMWEKNLQQYITAGDSSDPYGEKLEELIGGWLDREKDKDSPFMPDNNNDAVKAFTETLGRGDVRSALAESNAQANANAAAMNQLYSQSNGNYDSTLAANMRMNGPQGSLNIGPTNQPVTNPTLPQLQNGAFSSNMVSAFISASTNWTSAGTTVSARGEINFVAIGQAVGNAVAPIARAVVNNALNPQSTSAPTNSPNNPATQTKAPSPEAVGRTAAQNIANQVFNQPTKSNPAAGSTANTSSSANSSGRPSGRGSSP